MATNFNDLEKAGCIVLDSITFPMQSSILYFFPSNITDEFSYHLLLG